MKVVKFNRQMRPHVAGETRAVPDAVAQDLVDEGVAEVVPSVFDNVPEEPPPRRPRILPNLTRKTR
jgi:hypothetical protein